MGSDGCLAGDISPLRRFATCKDEIRRVFKNLNEVIDETSDFLSAIESLDQDELDRSLHCKSTSS